MKHTGKIILLTVLSLIFTLTSVVSVSAEDAVVYYFVDCGDFFVETAADGETMGIYNSVTEQFFGADPATGYEWGLVDEAIDEASQQSFGDTRLCTTWTWAYEQIDSADTYTKEETTRYCRNMFENGLDRVLTYKFEMPEDGEYVIEVGFGNQWNNSSPVDLYFNGELVEDTILIDSADYTYTYNTCSPVDGFITVEAKTMSPTLNMTYIIISNKLMCEETTAFEYDTYAPNTDPETDAPTDAPDTVTGTPADGDTDGAADDTKPAEDEKSGCGSSGAGAAIIAAATVASGAVIVKRKRK